MQRNHRRLLPTLAVLGATMFAGCSLVVMTQKMIWGDPTVPSAFKTKTRVDLARGKEKVVVICTVPQAVEDRYSSIGSDILESVTLKLKRQDIKVVSAETVKRWLEENNLLYEGIDAVAKEFDADYAIHIDVSHFTTRADNSINMLQGKTHATVRAYRIERGGSVPRAIEVYTDEDFSSTYPPNNPKPASEISSSLFLQKYIQRISKQLAQHFYDHPMSETVF